MYPEYASNMKDDMIPASPADGVQYAVPFYGYWEGLYVNKAVMKLPVLRFLPQTPHGISSLRPAR